MFHRSRSRHRSADVDRFAPTRRPGGQSLNVILFGTDDVVFSLIAQIGEQVTFCDFLPAPAMGRGGAQW